MSRIIQNLEVSLDEDLAQHLAWLIPDHGPYRILRQSIDARQRHSPHFVYTLEVAEKGEALKNPEYPIASQNYQGKEKPIIIGSGPAGLFAALRLVERGISCKLFERGGNAAERIKGINQYWRYGKLDPRNNVCYGEGGAGLYSDGKLITRIKSPHIPYVLQRLVKFGAPEEIQYLSNPHVGSDKIRRVIPKMREFLLSHGCEIYFNCKVEEILFEQTQAVGIKTEHGQNHFSSHIIVATGHSAEDMLYQLHQQGVKMEGKSFAVGIRVEHPQKLINKIQYREHSEHPKLGAANYRLTYNDEKSKVGVYSFCMCPGGYVLSSGTEVDRVVCNGMSNYHRNSPFANSAIVVSIDYSKHFGEDLMAGLKFRQALESQAFREVQKAGGSRQLPGQRLTDFLSKKISPLGQVSTPSSAVAVEINQLFSATLYQDLCNGIESFEKKMNGFITAEAHVFGVESRTSCPLRIVRDDVHLQSISHKGLYPCGEGAGYAGGITSAACDGVKIAEKIVEQLIPSRVQLAY